MSRPRIPIGGYGEITFLPRAKGKVEARTRFRDWDGQRGTRAGEGDVAAGGRGGTQEEAHPAQRLPTCISAATST